MKLKKPFIEDKTFKAVQCICCHNDHPVNKDRICEWCWDNCPSKHGHVKRPVVFKIRKCCFCGEQIEKGWGNNAEPLMVGRCCDKCNEKVLTARLRIIYLNETEAI